MRFSDKFQKTRIFRVLSGIFQRFWNLSTYYSIIFPECQEKFFSKNFTLHARYFNDIVQFHDFSQLLHFVIEKIGKKWYNIKQVIYKQQTNPKAAKILAKRKRAGYGSAFTNCCVGRFGVYAYAAAEAAYEQAGENKHAD